MTGAGKNRDRSAKNRECREPELGGGCSSSRAHSAVEWHNPLAEAGNRYITFLSIGLRWHGANGGELGGAPGVLRPRGAGCYPPEMHQAAGSEYLIAKHWLQKHLLMVQTGVIQATGNYQHGSVHPCLSTPKCPQQADCNKYIITPFF